MKTKVKWAGSIRRDGRKNVNVIISLAKEMLRNVKAALDFNSTRAAIHNEPRRGKR